MSTTAAFEVASAVIISLGGGAVLVLLMSGWLGRIWADRLMRNEKAQHDKALAELAADLRLKVDSELAASRHDLEIFKEKHLRGHHDKVAIYRLAVDVVVEILGDLDDFEIHSAAKPNGRERLDKLNRDRMRTYGYTAMLAPQAVMDALDDLFDHLLLVIGGREKYEWPRVRELAIKLLNEIRKDVGFDISPITYNGKL